jgi:hypothetical protein
MARKSGPDKAPPSLKKGSGSRKFGSASGRKIGGGSNKKAGALVFSPARDAMVAKRG